MKNTAACVIIASVVSLVTPWTRAHQAPLSMGFSRQEDWSGVPCPSPGLLPNQEIEPSCPAWQTNYHLAIWEGHVLTGMTYQKNRKTASVGKDVERGRPLCTTGGDVHVGNNMPMPQKMKPRIAICLGNSTSRHIFKGTVGRDSKRYLYTHIYSNIIDNSQKVETVQMSIHR